MYTRIARSLLIISRKNQKRRRRISLVISPPTLVDVAAEPFWLARSKLREVEARPVMANSQESNGQGQADHPAKRHDRRRSAPGRRHLGRVAVSARLQKARA